MKFNQLNRDSYKWRFGKEARIRTLEELHDIWIRAKARKSAYNKRFWDYLVECAKKVEPEERRGYKSHIIYFYNKKGLLCYFEISSQYTNGENTFSYSTKTVEFKNREDKLNYWLMDEENLKMGNELYHLQKFTRGGTEYIAFEIFFEVLKKRLDVARMGSKNSDKIIVVEVSGKKYFIMRDIDTYNYYTDYKFIGEYNEKVISL